MRNLRQTSNLCGCRRTRSARHEQGMDRKKELKKKPKKTKAEKKAAKKAKG